MASPALPSPLGQAALQYARRGWRVFPCREADDSYVNAKGEEVLLKAKAPYSGNGVKDATVDEEVIKGWWRRWPTAMIGLALGDQGLFALDFDPRHDEATGEEFTLERLKAELEEMIGCELPTSLAVRTPSDGVHVYLRQPADAGERLRNRVGTKKSNLPQHVDVRAAGGYVIVPPSRVIDGSRSGAAEGPYRWLRGKSDAEVTPAPAAVVELCRTRAKSDTAAPAERPRSTDSGSVRGARAGSYDDEIFEELRKYAMRGLDLECREVRTAGSGARNSQLNESALKIAALVAAGVLDETIARASIEAAARGNPGRDDDSQLLATIASGWSAGIKQPRDLGEIAAAIRDRLSRPASRAGPRVGGGVASSHAPAPRPASDVNGKPSSHGGGSGAGNGEWGPGELDRACAFLPQTDLGNLERFLKRHGRDFIFVEAWGWLAWDDRRWSREMAMAILGRAVQDTMRAMQAEAKVIRDSGVPPDMMEMWDDEQKAEHRREHAGKLDRVVSVKRGVVTLLSDTIAKWGRTSEGAGHIKCIAAMAEARLSRSVAEFDLDPLRVCVANGTLVFTRPEQGRKASVRLEQPHRREDLITRIATAAYVPTAACPAYDSFLERVQPDADMRAFLDVWAGYNMLGDASAQKMAIFYGEGANGKGVWINTKRAILGDYAWAASISTFMDGDRQRRGSEASPDLAALAGRRMVTANEAQEGSKFDDALVKELTSDEPKGGVRELLKAPFELQVTFKNTIICNNTPRIGTDHGIRRRMQIIPWGVIIPDEEQDTRLKARLIEEASGIMNRMVRGALAFLDGGLPVPEAIREATEKYLDENDILGRFLTLCVERADGMTVGASALHELFAAWQTWAQLLPASGKPWSPKYLAQQMEKRRFHKRKSSSMVWDDIATLYDPTDFLDSAGKPVVRDLPAPHRSTMAAPPAPPMAGGYDPFEDDDPPL